MPHVDSAMYSTTWQILQCYRDSIILEDAEERSRSPSPAARFRQGNPFDNARRFDKAHDRSDRYPPTPDSLSPRSPRSPRSSSPENGYASSNTSTSSYGERRRHLDRKEIRARRSPNGSRTKRWPTDLKLKKTNGATKLDSENLPMWKYTRSQLAVADSPPPPLPPKNKLRNSLQRLPPNPAARKDDRPMGLRRGLRDQEPSPEYRSNGPSRHVDDDEPPAGSLRYGLRRGADRDRQDSIDDYARDRSFSNENPVGKRAPKVANPFARQPGETQMPFQPVSKFSRDESSIDEGVGNPFAQPRQNNRPRRQSSVDSFGDPTSPSNDRPNKLRRRSTDAFGELNSQRQQRPASGSSYGAPSPRDLSKMVRGNLRSPSDYAGTPDRPPSSSYPRSTVSNKRTGFMMHNRKLTNGSISYSAAENPFSQPDFTKPGQNYQASVFSPQGPYPDDSERPSLRNPRYDVDSPDANMSLRGPRRPRQDSEELSPRSAIASAFPKPLRPNMDSPRTPQIFSPANAISSAAAGRRDLRPAASPPPPPPPPKGGLRNGPTAYDSPIFTPRSQDGDGMANSPPPDPDSGTQRPYGRSSPQRARPENRFDNLSSFDRNREYGARSPVPRYSGNPDAMDSAAPARPNPYAYAPGNSRYGMGGQGDRGPPSGQYGRNLAPPSSEERSNTLDSGSTSGNYSSRSGFSHGRTESNFSSASSVSSIPVGGSAFGRLSSGTGGPQSFGGRPNRRAPPSPSINVQPDAGLAGGPYPSRSARGPMPPKAPSAGRARPAGPPPSAFPMPSPSTQRLESPGMNGGPMDRPGMGGPMDRPGMAGGMDRPTLGGRGPLSRGVERSGLNGPGPALPAGPTMRNGGPLPGGNPRIGPPLPMGPGMGRMPAPHKRMASNFSTGSGPGAFGGSTAAAVRDPMATTGTTLGNGPYPASAPTTSGLSSRSGPRPLPPGLPGGLAGGLPGGPRPSMASSQGGSASDGASERVPWRKLQGPPPPGKTGPKGRPLPPGAGFGLPGVPKNIRAGVPGRPVPSALG